MASENRSSGNSLAKLAYLVVIIWGLAIARDFFIPLCIATLLAFMVLPAVRFLTKHRVPNWLAVALGTVLLLLPFFLSGLMLVRQGQSLVQDFPKIAKSLNELLQRFLASDAAHRLHLQDTLSASSLTEKLGSSASAGAQVVVSGLKTVLETGSQVLLVLVFTVLIVASREHLRVSFEKLLARFEHVRSANVLNQSVKLIEQFLLARMIIVAVVSVMAWVGLWIFGVPYSFLLGAVVGILTVIPELGFFVSLIPVIIVAAASGHSLVNIVGVLATMLGIHLIEANVFSPQLVSAKLNINVLASFVGLFGGGLLWGVWGMFLSVPILGIMRIAFCATPSLEPWGDLLSERVARKPKR